MAVIQPDWAAANKASSEKSGPDQYAPPDWPERPSNVDQSVFSRRQPDTANIGGEIAAQNLNALIRRVAGTSMGEIDRVMRELESVREMLRSEDERVSREISSYASLNHTATTAMQVIADSINQCKEGRDKAD